MCTLLVCFHRGALFSFAKNKKLYCIFLHAKFLYLWHSTDKAKCYRDPLLKQSMKEDWLCSTTNFHSHFCIYILGRVHLFRPLLHMISTKRKFTANSIDYKYTRFSLYEAPRLLLQTFLRTSGFNLSRPR